VNSLADLIAMARRAPGTLQYAVPQVGSPPHLLALRLCKAAGIDMVAVPFRGAPEALASVVAGEVPIVLDAPLTISPFVNKGVLKPLAVSGYARSELLPDTPTLAESGFPDFSNEAWLGLVVPAGVPATIVDRLNGVVSRVLRLPSLRHHYEQLGWRVLGGSPTEFASTIAEDRAIWGPIIRSSGIHLD
jgi:tripartite-type tricarboxylate transporter receptor subunit TctC